MDISLWTENHSDEANLQGWNLFAIDGNPTKLEIQKVDELEIFKTDEEAINFVRTWAGTTNRDFWGFEIDVCKLALELSGNK